MQKLNKTRATNTTICMYFVVKMEEGAEIKYENKDKQMLLVDIFLVIPSNHQYKNLIYL